MALPTPKRASVEELRALIARDFGAAVPVHTSVPGPRLPSGWSELDTLLAGGLAPGETAQLRGAPGSGRVALTSSWARHASREGEPSLVVDSLASTLPHPWVEPEDGSASIWVVRPERSKEAWPAVDIALRSGAFGLVVLLDPPGAPRGVGPRLVRIARDRACRLVVAGDVPFHPTWRITMRADTCAWVESPVGATPAPRRLAARTAHTEVERRHDVALTDRLRSTPRAPDRRTSHSRGTRARRGKPSR